MPSSTQYQRHGRQRCPAGGGGGGGGGGGTGTGESSSSSSSSSGYFAGQRKQAKQKKLYKMLTATAAAAATATNPYQQQHNMHEVSHAPHLYHANQFDSRGVTAVNNRVPLLNSPELQLRFLTPTDLPEVKKLCKEWFPIDYPDVWYDDITSNEKFYSYACVYQGKIIGLVVAEIRDFMKLPKEDSELLASTFR
jgi:hypothetical protein